MVEDFQACGVVGEATNLLVGYLAALSRKLDHPLAVVIQSSSSAGKSRLMQAILDFVPEEERLSFSAVTGQSLFYMGASDLKHRVLAIAEEAGAQRATYALRVLQSEGGLVIASTGKQPGTGRLVSQQYRVEGPVSILMTTAGIDIDDELVNRCLILSIDEGPQQTRAIHDRQRRAQTLEAFTQRQDRSRLVNLHNNAQRLIRPLLVLNPFAHEMTFNDHRVRARRDHQKLLTLIEALALLRQHQRTITKAEHAGQVMEYVEVDKSDVDTAVRLMGEVGNNGVDDLPPQTIKLLGLLDRFVCDAVDTRQVARRDFRFTRRELREKLGVGDTQLWIHLRRLVQAEYLIVYPSGRGRGIAYELAYQDGAGATDSEPDIRSDSGQIRPIFGGNSGGVRSPGLDQHAEESSPDRAHDAANPRKPNRRVGNRSRSVVEGGR